MTLLLACTTIKLNTFKTIFDYDAINITLGLKYIRVSPDHGIGTNIIVKKLQISEHVQSDQFLNKAKYNEVKKSLGQNFLIDKNILTKIVNLVNIDGENILEIGPGTGNLTNEILNKKPNTYLCIEKDKELNDIIIKKFQGKKVSFLLIKIS